MDQTVEQISEVDLVDLKGSLEGIDVLIVYGVGNGALYHSLSSWLQKEEQHYLIFVEEEETAFYNAQQLPLAQDSKVRLFFARGEEIFSKISWEFVFLRFGYASSEKNGLSFFSQLEEFHRRVDLLASDCQDMGVKVLSNAFSNLKHLPTSRLFHSLENRFAKIPVIVCGAGPSLNRAIPFLEQWKDRALIVAAGTAVQALSKRGISPHFCAHICPHPSSSSFLKQDCFEQPFFYQGRASSSILDRVHGPKIWIPDSGSYPLEGWMAAECGVFSEPLDSGWTVSNAACAIAVHLGCDPIICVGMDFSCGPDVIYASEIPGEKNRQELIELEKGVLYSKKDWLASAEWMGEFAKKHPEHRWINASEGGIDLTGFEKLSLEELRSEVLKNCSDIGALSQVGIGNAPISAVSIEKVGQVQEKVAASFGQCGQLCDQLLKIWEKHFPGSPLEKGEYVALDVELEQEICYRYVLEPLWNVWKQPILRSNAHPLGQHLHRLIFFKQVIEAHTPYLRSQL